MCNVAAFHYSFFGLRLRSNLRLSRLPLDQDAAHDPDCDLYFGVAPNDRAGSGSELLIYTSSFTDRSGGPALRVWKTGNGTYLRLDYSDGHQFWLDREGMHVWALWPDTSTAEEATSYLLGPVFGVMLRYRGTVCLHASAVAINGRAVVFLGPPGAGKSTMAAALSQRGCGVLADDIATIEEKDRAFYVHPAYPGLCLWPDSIELLYGRPVPGIAPITGGDKKCLSTDEGLRFEAHCLPLDRIYILDYGDSAATSIGGTSAQRAFLSLVANTYANNILDVQMRAQEFAFLGRLVSQVRVCNLRSRHSPVQLQRCCDLISADEVLG